ncbi:MAG: prepilin-type N-terminal cleavage/methylation domain-containing protein [Armatimonadota bacterium]
MHRSVPRHAFTLVELLAVVLVLSVLAAIAVPLYVNTRKTSAARACQANLASIARAESSYATRFGAYCGGTTADTSWAAAYTSGSPGVAPTGGLIGAPEGLAAAPACPLDATGAYTVQTVAGGSCTIACPSQSTHATDTGAPASKWVVVLSAPGSDRSNGY